MCSIILLTSAYALGLLGSILVACFGLPRTDVYPDGTEPLLADMESDVEKRNIAKRKRYNFLSRFGLIMIALSFLLQGVDVWL